MSAVPPAAASAGAGAAAAHAARVRATRASGAIVELKPDAFLEVLARSDAPIVVTAVGGFWSTNYSYLTNYRGLFFHCRDKEPIPLPNDAEVIEADRIWVPQ